ncbi:MBL fold metallo-hydrolase [Pleurocapsa sp. PCC 7319]|uniref:MBL fold metallo-hydrolase n=1 Tax=Pleurocapsa sp. PCC 7319 TaxID=118161 RepID=UPI000349A51E|nr:MBL fold metallo-hydrolase [Pleurocapsa sp. PCC 7319]
MKWSVHSRIQHVSLRRLQNLVGFGSVGLSFSTKIIKFQLWAIAVGVLFVVIVSFNRVEATEMNNNTNSEVYHFKIGSFQVAVISDGLLKLPPLPTYAPTANPQEVERAMLERFWSPNELNLYFNTVYVDTGKHKILIDTGAGSELGTGLARLIPNLHSIGIEPQDIDAVIITHAHPDHIGGIVKNNGQLTFPNARYHISKAEWQFWTAKNIDLSSLKIPVQFKESIKAAAHKHLEAITDRVNLFQPKQEIVPGIYTIDAAGHTPGQSVLRIVSDNEQLIVAADVFFNPAFDLEHPDWQTGFDFDPLQAQITRRKLLDEIVRERTMVVAYHMPFPALGYVRSRKDRYEWQPVLWQFGDRPI